METSDKTDQVLELGKILAIQMEKDGEFDLTTQWMAHYLAELMTLVDTAKGKAKKAAQQQCFDLIVKLWEYRWYHPYTRPLEDFAAIFHFLEKMVERTDEPFYFKSYNAFYHEDEPDQTANPVVMQWIEKARQVDASARISMGYLLKKAADHASDDKLKNWINAQDIALLSFDLKAIKYISGHRGMDAQSHKNYIMEQIEQLRNFQSINEELIAAYQEELEKTKDD